MRSRQKFPRAPRAGVPALSHEQTSLFQPPEAVGPYRVRRVIAAGTLGPCLLVEDVSGQEVRALKLVTTVQGDDAAALAAALGDYASLPVTHPGVVAVLDVGVDPAGVYLVTEFVEAPVLESRLRGGRQPLVQVLEWLEAPAAALEEAHGRGRRHGAIHPRDILLPRGRGVLTGLDVSPALEALGLQAPVRVPFTAPERASGKEWDARADQYSLAMLALDALSGRRLIAGTIPAFDRWTLADTPAEDARLHEVFAQALHPDPAQRFPSIGEWIDALSGAGAPASELSKFTRDGVIPAAGPDVRRAPQTEILDDAMPLALFPAEEPASPPTVEAPVTPKVDTPGPEAPLQAATGEWLVASMPDDTTPLADTGPMPIQSVTGVDPPEPDAAPEPLGQVAADDYILRSAEAEDAHGPAYTEQTRWTQTQPDDDATWRRGPLVLGVALLLVALVAFGTWRSLRAPATSGEQAADVSDLPTTATEQEVARASPPEPLPDEAFQSGADDLTPGVPPPEAPDASPGTRGPGTQGAGRSREPEPRPGARAQVPAPVASAPAPSTPEVPQATDMARILIRSSPAGQVRVNGQPRGQTPVVLRDLPFGSYIVTISRPGYLDAVRQIAVLPSQPAASLAVDLERRVGESTAAEGPGPARPPAQLPDQLPAPPPASAPAPAQPAGVGSVYVVSRPTDARLFINGRAYGTAPAVVPGLPAGRYVVRVERSGYRAWESTIDVLPGQRLRVDATLVQESR